MNNSEKEIDELIHQALSKEEAEYFDQLGEQDIPQMLIGFFTGKLAWMNVLISIITLAVFGLTIYTMIEMFAAEVINDKLEWMTFSILGFVMMALLKTWGWNQMDKNALMREIKRLEYQVSLLSEKKRT